jgi:hypothetical protein
VPPTRDKIGVYVGEERVGVIPDDASRRTSR